MFEVKKVLVKGIIKWAVIDTFNPGWRLIFCSEAKAQANADQLNSYSDQVRVC